MRLARSSVLACLVSVLSLGCSATSSDNGYNQASGGGTAAGGSGGEDGGTYIPDGSSGTGGTGGTAWNTDSGAMDAEPLGDGEACTGISQAAEPYPLDMYVMMDQSGSMSDVAGVMSNTTKWDAIATAFQSFMANTTSTGLSMGIQYFPLPVVPWSSFGACDMTDPNNPSCPNNGVCLGLVNSNICVDQCSTSSDCGAGQECITGSPGYCNNDSCDFNAYAAPEVEIAQLPGVASAINQSLSNHGPTANTPTAPALHGAIAHARQWADAHPDDTTIVILATDGIPTVCPADNTQAQLVNLSKQAAADGLTGTPKIKTFVIGVVLLGDFISKNNLNAIAQAGGTGNAFIVDPSQDLTTQFSQTLEAIRGASMPCEFKIPDTGAMLDYGMVNVIYTATNQQQYPVYYVANQAACDPTDGGWYYDTDPTQSKPTKIVLCPASCTFIQNYGGKIDIQIGCKTMTPPK